MSEARLAKEKLTVSVREAAEEIGISYSTAWRLVKDGRLRTIPGLRCKLIPRSELYRFVNSAK